MTINFLLLFVISILIVSVSPSAFSSGPRLDYGDDVTDEEADCWVDGYDAGFAGKYDQGRADECETPESDQYNSAWEYACKDAPYTEDECAGFKNIPLDIENHEALQQENKSNCYNDGVEDGKSDNPYDKDRASGCSEYGGMYRDGYQFACQSDSTESSCELLIEGHESYCPSHPDITACVEFLRDPSNKKPAEDGVCAGMGDPRPNFTCFKENDPERYCLNHNDPFFCKTVGIICDADGFVKPEYPYCK